MNSKILIAFTFWIFSALFCVNNIQAQELESGGKAKLGDLENFGENFCIDLTGNIRVCKGRDENDDWNPKFLIQHNKRTLCELEADFNATSTESHFMAYRGDLDKDGSQEIVISSLVNVTNGIGISTYKVYVFRDPVRFGFQPPFTFPIEEFGEKGNFIYDSKRKETLILLTYWNSYESLDPKRVLGMYLVGRWFRYRKGLLEPVFDKPTLARRYLNSFANERGESYKNPNAPYMWLKSKNTHRFFAEPEESAKLIDTKYGLIKKFERGEFTIKTNLNENFEYSLGCCPADFAENQRITISEFGVLPQKFVFPNHFFEGYSPRMNFNKLEGKRIKLEIYQAKYLKYAKLWFLER